jgi:hypothetical protein
MCFLKQTKKKLNPANINHETQPLQALGNDLQRPHPLDTTVLYDLINAFSIFRSTQLRKE